MADITGYRELSEDEKVLINEIKAKGEELGQLIEKLRAGSEFDQRWISIAQTHFQEGGMAAVRAVARPTTF
jgi:hypothetical protein